jgi:hypothetical protein
MLRLALVWVALFDRVTSVPGRGIFFTSQLPPTGKVGRAMLMIDKTDDDLDPGAVFAAAYDPPSNGNDDYAALNADAGEFDPYTMRLIEALGDALGMTRIELRREWQAADAKLLERSSDLRATSNNLERELKTLTAGYESAQARIAELEHQIASLTEKRVASLEKHTKALVRPLPGKIARIAELESQVKALGAAIAGATSARDLDSRIAYLEALMSTMFPMPTLSQA